MISAGRFLRRGRLPRAPLSRPSPSSTPSGGAHVPGRNFCLAGPDAHITDTSTVCNSHRRRLEHARWLSTSSSPSNDGPPIEVTVTNSSDASDETSSDAGDNTGGSDGSPSGPNLSKSPDQMVEEKLLALQGELRTHHRHAAYENALGTATELLELSADHFGNLHPATASAHNNVGLMHKMLGHYAEAREAYHEALRIYGEVVGKDHASYAAALSNLGMLERGRVLESEAEDGNEDESDNSGKNEEGTELEELRDGNAQQKSKMSALERMQLNESAIEYFDEAYRIRLSELGSNHPHTIISRSHLGASMAAAVIAERKGRIGGLVESELRKMKHQKDAKDAKEMEAYVPEAVARAAAKSSSGSKLTRRRWEAAEEHLRGALATAVENPRGGTVSALISVPMGKSDAGSTQSKKRRGLTLPPKDEKSLSKKERRKLEKERLRERRRATREALGLNTNRSGDGKAGSGGGVAVQGAAAKVTTLSAATAAQNLAVFLKNYADWLRLTLMDERAQKKSQRFQSQLGELNKVIQEARHLYEAALHVRGAILPPHHPDVVATKFSLAELLDSPALVSLSTGESDENAIDGDRANILREEILSAYNVEERQDNGDVAK